MITSWAASAGAAEPEVREARGEWDGEVALDVLHATSTSDAPDAGPTPALSATELGMRIRGTADTSPDGGDGVLAALDYQGREAVAGTFPTTTWRLFYRAELVGTLADGHLDLAAGRFLAPSVMFLPVDGARAAWRPGDHVALELFAGRRGVTTARQTVDFGTLLPAVGGAGRWTGDRASAEVLLSFAGDQLLEPSVDPELATTVDTWESLGGSVRGQVEPVDQRLYVGGTASATQRASFVFLPTPGAAVVTAQALDLYQAYGWARWRASDAVRVDVDVARQAADLEYAGADAPGVDFSLVDPTFTDLRGRAGFEVVDSWWLRPDVRLRLRTGRSELRYGLGADLADLVVDGPFVRGRFWLEDIGMGGEGDDVGAIDRVYWSGSAGWSAGPVDAELGASRMDRAAGYVSTRTTTGLASDDLSPFVLAAQDVGFARLFVTDRGASARGTHGWFAGLDGEMNLTAQPEVRAFVQVGLLGDGQW